ncbi:MAG: hypothetical protein V7K35_01415 [Nostoc sp.]|uniref:hypothetical protein n=1 Tax=Nostoc sp. TaxID=1180 RepID=UPI002FFCEB83
MLRDPSKSTPLAYGEQMRSCPQVRIWRLERTGVKWRETIPYQRLRQRVRVRL